MKAKIIGLVCGILVTPVALFLAMISAGAGHGDYLAARLLYPIPMMYPYLIHLVPTSITLQLLTFVGPLAAIVACAQYPYYGWLAGAAYMYERRELARKLLYVHFGALLIVVIFPSPYFS